MKTLYITAVICSLLVATTASGFTTINLPIYGIYKIPVDNAMVFHQETMIENVIVTNHNEKTSPNQEDTIVIDLKEVVITEGFPQRSHACLQRQVKYPDFALKEKLEGVVAVTMLFNREGNVEIVDSYGNDPRLEQYVHEKLYGLHLNNCSVEMNKPFNARFTFRLF